MSAVPLLGPCSVPAVGLGTNKLLGPAGVQAVRFALETGFRLIDTAAAYRNEEIVGEGIHQSGVPRSELFVVVKVPPKSAATEDAVRESVLRSIDKLGIGYADLVLLHWPGCAGLSPTDAEGQSAARRRGYRALQRLQKENKVRWLGVSNYLPRHFSDIDAVCESAAQPSTDGVRGSTDRPVVNQVELNPWCVQEEVQAYARGHGIVLQQYAPLAQGSATMSQHAGLIQFVREHFSTHTVWDVLLMWGLSQGFCVLVRSERPEHIAANWRAAVDFFTSTSERQRAELLSLRTTLCLDSVADTHLCWFSKDIA